MGNDKCMNDCEGEDQKSQDAGRCNPPNWAAGNAATSLGALGPLGAAVWVLFAFTSCGGWAGMWEARRVVDESTRVPESALLRKHSLYWRLREAEVGRTKCRLPITPYHSLIPYRSLSLGCFLPALGGPLCQLGLRTVSVGPVLACLGATYDCVYVSKILTTADVLSGVILDSVHLLEILQQHLRKGETLIAAGSPSSSFLPASGVCRLESMDLGAGPAIRSRVESDCTEEERRRHGGVLITRLAGNLFHLLRRRGLWRPSSVFYPERSCE